MAGSLGVEAPGGRRRGGRGVAGRHGARDADAGGTGPVQEAGHEVAGLAGDADVPGRRVRRHDLGAQSTPAWTPRPGRWARPAGCRAPRTGRPASASSAGPPRRPPRSPAVVRNAARTPFAAAARSRSGLAALGVHTKIRSAAPVGQLLAASAGVDPEHRGAVAVGGEHLAAVAGGQDVVQAHEAELARVGRGPGDHDPAGLEQGPEVLRGLGAVGPCGVTHGSPRRELHQGVDGDRPAVVDDERVEVDGHDPWPVVGAGAPRRTGPAGPAPALAAVHRWLAPELPEQRLGGRARRSSPRRPAR